MSSENSNGRQFQRSIQIRLIITALLLLLLALGFNALLSLNSLEKLYVESIASQYSAIGKDLQRNIESALRFGKSIEKFVGIEALLEDTKTNLSKDYVEDSSLAEPAQQTVVPDISVSVALTDGMMIYSTDEGLIGNPLPTSVHLNYGDLLTTGMGKVPGYIHYNSIYYTPLPILDRTGAWVATAIIAFDEYQIRNLLDRITQNTIRTITVILISSMALLVILLNLALSFNESQQHLSKWRIALIMLLVIGTAQIVFAVFNTRTFGQYYLQINQKKARTLTTLLGEDIEFLFSKGIKIDKLVKIDTLMGDILEASPEISGIKILDSQRLPLYMATDQEMTDFQKAPAEELRQAYILLPVSQPQYTIRLELRKDDAVQGFLSTHLSREKILATLIEIGLDSATILVISMLFFGELLLLTFVYLDRQLVSPERQAALPVGAIRPAGFLLLFGMHSCISFLPLYMQTLYRPLWNLPKDLVLGLPISAEMFFTGVSMFIAGTWMDRRGWHEPFISGLLLTGGGMAYCWWAPDALQFILARGLVGLGYGFALMASQGFVIVRTETGGQAHGLAQLFAGVYAGSICGSSAGAMLAERFGYRMVFLIGGGLIGFVLVYTLTFLKSAFQKPVDEGSTRVGQQAGFLETLRFFFNRNVLSLNILSALPSALVLVGFLNYFSPIYLRGIGASQSNIGRIFMIYGVCLVYIAPLISKYIDAAASQKRFIIISGLLGSAAIVIFYRFEGIATVALAVFFLGLSSSFAAAQRSYILKLRITRALGSGKAMGIFNSVYRIGQVLGPMMFGWFLVLTGFQQGMLYIGGVYVMTTLLFLLVAQNQLNTIAPNQG